MQSYLRIQSFRFLLMIGMNSVLLNRIRECCVAANLTVLYLACLCNLACSLEWLCFVFINPVITLLVLLS